LGNGTYERTQNNAGQHYFSETAELLGSMGAVFLRLEGCSYHSRHEGHENCSELQASENNCLFVLHVCSMDSKHDNTACSGNSGNTLGIGDPVLIESPENQNYGEPTRISQI
jgi:hypothetical protein